MKVYYAHCIAIYSTPQEDRDVETLETLGFEVFNPNSPAVDAEVKRLKAAGDENYMSYFTNLIRCCDALAFRALPDGQIPAGVAKEIGDAEALGLPVFELPSYCTPGGRVMSLENTRRYLKEIGAR